MGSQFSSGAWLDEVKPLVDLNTVYIMSRVYQLDRIIDKDFEDSAFLDKKQIQQVMKLSDRRVFDIFNILDPKKTGKIAKVEFFGALALAASDIPSEKVGIGFAVADEDEDGHLSQIDVEVLFTCATRAVSLMKSVEIPSQRTIKKICHQLFTSNAVALNEKGWVNCADIKAFCAVNDLCRTYFADLGTQVEVVDTGKLVSQRKKLQMDLIKYESKLTSMKAGVEGQREDERLFRTERGGDYLLLKLNDEDKNLLDEEKQEDDSVGRLQSKMRTSDSSGISEAQRLRRLKRRKQRKESTNLLTDAAVFATGGKPSDKGLGGLSSSLKNIEQQMMFKWDSFEPQTSDKLYKLDIDTLEDLFEAGGVSMSDKDSHSCLDQIPHNVQGSHCLDDVIKWYREFTKISKAHVSSWRQVARKCRETWLDVKKGFRTVMDAMRRQLDVKSDIDSSTERSDAYNVDTGERNLVMGADGRYKHQFKFSREFPPSDLFNKLPDVGFAKLNSWQRNQLLKDPAKIMLNATFNRPEVQEEDPKKTKKEKAKKKKGKNEEENVVATMKSSVSIDFVVNPETLASPYPGLVDTSKNSSKMQKRMDDLKPIDLLEMDKSNETNSVIWFSFDLVEDINTTNQLMLVESAKNFFNGIPYDYRSDLYTHVDAFVLDEPDEDNAKHPKGVGDMASATKAATKSRLQTTKSKEEASEAPAKPPKILFVALYSEEGYLKNIEDSIPNGIFVSRAIRNFSVKFEFDKNFDDIFQESSKYVGYERKLFGPQEEEIGEELANPIKFAKVTKQRKNACEDVLKNINHISIDELRKQLNAYGLSEKGSQYELKNRVIELFKRQIDMIGFGELSKFGEQMVRKIFRHFDEDKDGALSLWELNAWLFELGEKTFGNKKDYENLVTALGLQTKKAKLRKGEKEEPGIKRDEYVTVQGIIALYEKFGRLYNDLVTLGIGSLNEQLSGNLKFNCSFDYDALESLASLFESHTLFFPHLKRILAFMTSLRGFAVDGNYKRISDIPFIRDNKFLTQLLNEPGWIANAMNKISEWLADGDNGFLRSVRINALEKLGMHSLFDHKIEKFGEVSDPPEESKEDQLERHRVECLQKVKEALPTCVETKNISSQLKSLYERNEELLFSVTDTTTLLSRHEREKLKGDLKAVDLEIQQLRERLENSMIQITGHFNAFYDSVRKLTKGPLVFGLGTREMCLKVGCTGISWKNILPEARGEIAASKKVQIDKIERAIKRKKLALAAIKREQQRRNMTDEERELLRLQKEEKLRAEIEKKWQEYFQHAYSALMECREESKNINELKAMESKWSDLVEFSELKYPGSLKLASCQTNFATILFDFMIKRDAKKKDALLNNLKTSANIVFKIVKPYLVEHKTEREDGGADITYSLKDMTNDNEQVACYIVLLHNYMLYLRVALGDLGAVQRNSEMMIMISLMNDLLSEKEKQNLHVERSVAGVHVIPLMKNIFAAEYEKTLEAADKYMLKKIEPEKTEEEKEMEEAGAVEFTAEDEEIMMKLTQGIDVSKPEQMSRKELRDLKKAKEMNRAELNAKRDAAKMKAIEDRKTYYALIQNDSISEIFSNVASNKDMADAFDGLHGDNSHIIDIGKRQNTDKGDVIVSNEGGYDLVIDIGEIAQDEKIDLKKAEEEAHKFKEDEFPIEDEHDQEDANDEVDDDPNAIKIPEGAGECIAVRDIGATVRDGPDVENSEVIYKIRQHKKMYFDKIVIVNPKDRRCLPVERLHVYVQLPKKQNKAGEIIEGWVSRTGRTKSDHYPLIKITVPCTIIERYNEEHGTAAYKSQYAEVPPGCGSAMVVKRTGATLRTGVNIDASEIIATLKYHTIVHFDRIVRVDPTDKRCKPVDRLHVYYKDPKGWLVEGWLSMSGRIIEDTDPIMKVRKPMAARDSKTGEIIQKKGPLSWLWGNKKKSLSAEATPAVDIEGAHYAKKSQDEKEASDEKRRDEFIKHQLDNASDVTCSDISAADVKSFYTFKSEQDETQM